MPKVLNKHTASKEELEGAVYVGRPTKWGNPHPIGAGPYASREDVIRLYAQWVAHRHQEIKQDLKGEGSGVLVRS